MTNYPYTPDPYGPTAGGGAASGSMPTHNPYSQPPAYQDPYSYPARLPQAGDPYPGYGPAAGPWPGAWPGPACPDPRVVGAPYPAVPTYDPVLAQVQQMAAMSTRTSSNLLGYWALGMSIMSIVCCTYGVCQLVGGGLGIAGIVAANNGHATNKGVSITAVVLSVVSLVLWIVVLVVLYSMDTTV